MVVGTNVVALIAIVLVLVLALISWKIDMIPRRLLALVKQERAREDGQAQTALLEAAAAKVGPVVAGIRTYHDQLEASLRAQLAEAETRARVSERRALDASTYLQAASTLVADLRNLRDERALLVRAPTVASAPAPEPSAEPGDPDQRVTTEVRRRPASVLSPTQAVAPLASAPILPAEPAMVAARLVSRAPSEPARPASS
jgi:predicted component of type VI protein secretion system